MTQTPVAPAVAPLFTPFKLNGLTLPNRIVMAPMTRSHSPDGVPGDDVAAYYRRRAEGGVGLIVTEGAWIPHPAAGNDPNVPQFYGDDALIGWAKVVEEVHAAGGRIFPQLWHVGGIRRAENGPNEGVPPASPSGLFKPGKQIGAPMTIEEAENVIDAFATAASTAHRLGFDGIELHGAHGYLIDQFFWAGTNLRTDRFGGDLVARTRFAVEIIKECRKRTAYNFPIVLRFSQWKQQDYAAKLAETPDELAAFLAPLVAAGVDGFHCSTRRFWEPEFAGSDMNLAGWTKKLSGKPAITVGSVSLDQDFFTSLAGKPAERTTADLGRLVEMLARGDFDLVAVGRALLQDPNWVQKVRAGQLDQLAPFDPAVLKVLT